MFKQSVRVLLCVITIITLAYLHGCTSVKTAHTGKQLDRALIDTIQAGTTTKQEIIENFGEPSNISTTESGKEIFTYVYEEEKTPTYLGGLIENKANRTVATSTLDITFIDDVVSTYRFKRTGTEERK